jgi:hypothetical protein
MNTDLYASRFMPSVLNQGISQLLRVEISTDGTEWKDFIHIPIYKEPSLSKTDITVIDSSESE